MGYRYLTAKMAERFLTDGYIKVPGALDAEFCREQVRKGFEHIGMNPDDPTTWTEPRVHLRGEERWAVKDIAPKVHDAMCDLMGGADRFHEPFWSNAFIFNFFIADEKRDFPPTVENGGWHKDGDFFRHFLDSPEQALLVLVCWSDVVERGGPTYVAPESVGIVARDLAQRPEGYRPNEMPFKSWLSQCTRFDAATAKAGDVFLLHPFMLHSASANVIRAVRVISNPPAQFVEPMRFNRENPDDFSLVEQTVLRALGVERFDFQPTVEREKIVPERIKRQQAMEAKFKADKQAQAGK